MPLLDLMNLQKGFVLGFTDYDGSSNTIGTNQVDDISFGSITQN